MSGLASALAAFVLLPATARADTNVSITPVRSLDFGSFVLMGSGSKQIGADGSITTSGLMPVRGTREGPAEFQIVYAPNSHAPLTILQLTLGTVTPLTMNGATGKLDSFVTDLADTSTLVPGQPATLRLPACGKSTCTITFHVGGRLSLSGVTTGASFVFPLPMTVRLLGGG